MSTMNSGMSGSAIATTAAACQSATAMTTTVAGVSIPASATVGRYPVKYGRRPSSPRVTTTVASSSTCCLRCGFIPVTVCSTRADRSPIAAVAARWLSRACSH